MYVTHIFVLIHTFFKKKYLLPFNFVELSVIFLHAGPDPADPLPEHHVGLRRGLPDSRHALLVVNFN